MEERLTAVLRGDDRLTPEIAEIAESLGDERRRSGLSPSGRTTNRGAYRRIK